MISIAQLYQSGAPTGSNIYITNLGVDVSRRFLNDSFSYGNTYTFDFEGNIFDNGFSDGKLSQTIEDRMSAIAAAGKFNYRVKSISFPNAATDLSENIRFSKFNMSVEFQEKTSDYTNFSDYTGGSGFTNLMPSILENSGEVIQDISETFNFDEGQDGVGKFSHSVNFTLFPVTGNSIASVIGSSYLRNAANSIVAGFTNYSNFVNISKLFTGQGFQFNNNFFTQHTGRMTHSETADILGNTYSLTRSKIYYTGYNEFYCFDHNYNLSVSQDGSVEVSEETKVDGEADYNALLVKFNTEIDPVVSNVINGGNTYSNVRQSYSRCAAFLSNYHQFLRLRKTESDSATYFSHYTNSTSLYSLRPIPIEKTLTSIPELPSLVSNVKYTTNPNINFGYESDESMTAKKNKGIFDVTYNAKVKTFNFQTGDLVSFNSEFGSQAGVTNFSTLVNNSQNGLIKKASVSVHNLINGTQEVSLRKLRPDASDIPLALIKKSSSLSRRGKDFSLTLSFSSDNKYAPLYFQQDPNVVYGALAPAKGQMFQNLVIPVSVRQFLADNFTFFDKKVNITIPQEKFQQRIVLARPQGVAIIDPSVQSSTGKLTISFNMKVNRGAYNFFEGGNVTLLGSGKYIDYIRTLISQLFSVAGGSSFSPIFHATVNSEISKIIDVNSNIHKVNGYVPTSITYKFDSDFNLEVSVDVEFYSKSVGSKRKPIFGFRGDQDYGNGIVTKTLFNQQNSY